MFPLFYKKHYPFAISLSLRFPCLCKRCQTITILDALDPISRPGSQTVIGSGECTSQAGDRIGIARTDGSAANGGLRIVGEEQEAEQTGSKRFLSDPACASCQAGIALPIHL